jgi:hypothetical protein
VPVPKPDSPAAAWYFFVFSTKNSHKVKIFCGKDLISSALLETLFSAKHGIACSMAALVVSRISFISWCSWSKHRLCNACQEEKIDAPADRGYHAQEDYCMFGILGIPCV